MPPFKFWLCRVKAVGLSSSRPGEAAEAAAAAGISKICIVCDDKTTAASSMTFPSPCDHSYCTECLRTYVAKSFEDRARFPPTCCGVCIPQNPQATALLGKEAAAQLELMMAEHDDPDKTYCANKACATYLRRPPERVKAKYIKCHACKEYTCRRCKYPWHRGGCTKSLAEDQVKALAATRGWKQCFKCKQIVERNGGCDHMTCRCGAQFCYFCGVKYPDCGLRCQQFQPPANLAQEVQAMQAAIARVPAAAPAQPTIVAPPPAPPVVVAPPPVPLLSQPGHRFINRALHNPRPAWWEALPVQQQQVLPAATAVVSIHNDSDNPPVAPAVPATPLAPVIRGGGSAGSPFAAPGGPLLRARATATSLRHGGGLRAQQPALEVPIAPPAADVALVAQAPAVVATRRRLARILYNSPPLGLENGATSMEVTRLAQESNLIPGR